MSVNTVLSAGQVRTPRALLLVGGTPMPWSSFDMQHNGIYETGTLTVKMPVGFDMWPFWLQQTEILIDVYVGFPVNPDEGQYTKDDLVLMMTARCDEIRLDPATSTMTMAGRDLTSLFTDNKVDGTYQNLTSSQIIAKLAANFPQFQQLNIQKTTGSIGAFLTQDHTQIQASTTMWKLMTYLAQHEGLQLFVLGRQLYFGDFGSTFSDQPYKIQYTPPSLDNGSPKINVTRLDFAHDLTISGDVSVRVRSFHGQKNAAYSATAKATRQTKSIEKSLKTVQTAQHYDFVFPGLTQDQCQKKADDLLKSISIHEYKLEASMPADLQTFPWTPIVVEGTGTAFDTSYNIARIGRRFDKDSGYTMNISARTAPNAQEVTLS